MGIRQTPLFSSRLSRSALFALILGLAGPSYAGYTFTLPGMLPYYDNPVSDSVSGRVTNSRLILGIQSVYDGPFAVVIWYGDHITNVTAAAGLPGPGPYEYFHPTTMNESGNVVGTLWKAECNSCHFAAKWNGKALVELGSTTGYGNTTAVGINDAGDVVGYTDARFGQPQGVSHATLWKNGAIVDLGTLGGYDSYAYAINNAGTAVGRSEFNTGNTYSHATLWQNGSIYDLGTLGGNYSQAVALNERNQVVGQSDTSDSGSRATLWDKGAIINLGSLFNTPYSASGATSINEHGVIVGFSYDESGSSRATLWDDGVITDLNDYLSAQEKADGWVLTYASDINDRGWIVGNAYNALTDRTRAFLLTSPVPEPGTYLMLLVGLGMLIAFLRRTGQQPASAAPVERSHFCKGKIMGIPNCLVKRRSPTTPALFIALLGFAAPSFAIDYTFVPLAKIFNGSEQYYWGDHARTINNANQILVAVDPATEQLGYRIDWQGNTAVYTPLESLVGAGNTYEVNGFNNSGHLAGSSLTAACPGLGCSSGFKWEGGAKIPLDSQGRSSRAFAMNDAGQVAGITYPVNDEGNSHAALWSNGTFTDLGALGGGTSKATDINNNGAVVGYSYPGVSFEARATLWQNGAIQDLGTFDGGIRSYAAAINDNGQIAGYATRADGITRPVLWDQGAIIDLLANSYPTFDGVANDVNIHGAAVGRFGMGETNKAALFQNGTAVDLNWFLSEEERNWWWLRNARSINDRGWIVGDAMTQGFEHYAFLLIPQVPEPGTYLMLGIGLVLTLVAARRRNAASTGLSMN